MITQKTINKFKEIIAKKEVEITGVDEEKKTVAYTLPYSAAELCLFIDSDDETEQIVEFCEGINAELECMIDHLDESKLSVPIPDLE